MVSEVLTLKEMERTASSEEMDRTHTENGIDKEELKEEAHRRAKELSVPLEEAERMVYSSYDLEPPKATRSIDHLSDLSPGMRNVSVRARVISVHRARRQDGEGSYYYGIIGDSTSTIPFSSWIDFEYDPGDALVLDNISVREWKERPEVVINRYTTVSELDDAKGLIPSMEDGVPSAVSELTDGTVNVDVVVRIVEAKPSELTVNGVEKEVVHGTIADTSGVMDYTCWGPVDLEEGACYRITGGYARNFRGVLKMNFDAGSLIRRMGDDLLPPVEELTRPRPSRIIDLMTPGPGGAVEVRGTVVDVRAGSGFILRCPECGRRSVKGRCVVHGKVDGEPDLSLRALFDDGSGSAMIKGDRWIVESIIGRGLDEIREEILSSMDLEEVEETLRSILIGHPWTIKGDAVLDDYGLSIYLHEMERGWDMQGLIDENTELMGVVL